MFCCIFISKKNCITEERTWAQTKWRKQLEIEEGFETLWGIVLFRNISTSLEHTAEYYSGLQKQDQYLVAEHLCQSDWLHIYVLSCSSS